MGLSWKHKVGLILFKIDKNFDRIMRKIIWENSNCNRDKSLSQTKNGRFLNLINGIYASYETAKKPDTEEFML